jgi:hypothetical protein
MKDIIPYYKDKDITPFNERGKAHGYWEVYWAGTDNLMYKAFCVNGEPSGYKEYSYAWKDYPKKLLSFHL